MQETSVLLQKGSDAPCDVLLRLAQKMTQGTIPSGYEMSLPHCGVEEATTDTVPHPGMNGFKSSLLMMCAEVTAQGPGYLPPTWEPGSTFLAPSFSRCLSQASGEQTSRGKALCPTLSFKSMKEVRVKRLLPQVWSLDQRQVFDY